MLLYPLLFFLLSIWLSLVYAAFGYFSAGLVIASALLLTGCFAVATHKQRKAKAKPFDLLVLLVAIITLFFTIPSGEQILGGWDPGVYMHTGKQVADHGSLQFDHPDLASLTDAERNLLARNPTTVVEPFSGVRVLPSGKLTPQFYHAYPSLLALFIHGFGLKGGLLVNPILNSLSIIAFYALILVFTKNRWWAMFASVMLALNPAQVWLAKFSTAEILTQFLFLSGFALLYHWHQKPSGRNLEALVGGMALGLAQLTRYDTLIVLAVALPVLALSAQSKAHRRGLLLALGALAVAVCHAWAHQRWIAPYYQPLGTMVGKALAICFGIATILLGIQRLDFVQKIRGAILAVILATASIGWSCWMIFNWLIRPTLHAHTHRTAWLTERLESINLEALLPTLVGPPSRAMLYLESILSPFGLSLAIAGVALALCIRRSDTSFQPWMWGGLGITMLLTWNPYNDLFMMWVSRRYVPLVIPWLIAGAVIAASDLSQRLQRRHARLGHHLLIAPLLTCAFLLPVLPATQFLAQQRDWPGLIAWYERLDKLLPDHAVVYTDQPGFGAPLRFIWNHQAYELHRPTEERRIQFAALLDDQANLAGSLYLVSSRPPDARLLPNSTITPVADIPLKTHMIRHTRTRIPRTLVSRGGAFGLYKITAKSNAGS